MGPKRVLEGPKQNNKAAAGRCADAKIIDFNVQFSANLWRISLKSLNLDIETVKKGYGKIFLPILLTQVTKIPENELKTAYQVGNLTVIYLCDVRDCNVSCHR